MHLSKVIHAIVLFALAGIAQAAPLTEGNILYQSRGYLYERTRDGDLVQTIPIPEPVPGWRSTEYARDIVALNETYVLVYNGTFDPYLSVLDLTSDTWTHLKEPTMWTVNNGSYGGIAANEDYAFATSMGPDYNDPNGVARFDLSTGTSMGIGADVGAIDLNLGLDGKLYVLYPGGSPGGRFINVYDPARMAQIGHISLASIFGHTAHRAIAVNADGDVFIADWDGDIQKIDEDGTVLATTNICSRGNSCSQYDIDIDEFGTVVTTTRFGDVHLLDSNLEVISSFRASTSGGFASFIGSAFSLKPIRIRLDAEVNVDGCVEATSPEGALVNFSLITSNPEPLVHRWAASSGEEGTGATFAVQVGVGENVVVHASITEPVSGDSREASSGACVSDTTAPHLEIVSPVDGDVIKPGKIDLDVRIEDVVDQTIDSYDVFLGRILTLPFPSDPGRFNIDLTQSGAGSDGLIDLIVTVRDASGNEAEASVVIQLKGGGK